VLCVRSAYGRVDTRDWQDRVRDYEAIGSAVHHSTKAVWLSEWYGGPLRYHGQVAGTNSPHQIDFNAYSLQGRSVVSGADILRALLQRSPAEFFIVTDLAELAAIEGRGRAAVACSNRQRKRGCERAASATRRAREARLSCPRRQAPVSFLT
jgi:hypothetical protein